MRLLRGHRRKVARKLSGFGTGPQQMLAPLGRSWTRASHAPEPFRVMNGFGIGARTLWSAPAPIRPRSNLLHPSHPQGRATKASMVVATLWMSEALARAQKTSSSAAEWLWFWMEESTTYDFSEILDLAHAMGGSQNYSREEWLWHMVKEQGPPPPRLRHLSLCPRRPLVLDRTRAPLVSPLALALALASVLWAPRSRPS